MIKNETVQIYENGNITRDFVDVRDVAKYFGYLALDSKERNSFSDFGSGKQTNLFKLATILKEILNSASDVVTVPKYRLGDCKFAQSSNRNIAWSEQDFRTLKSTIIDFVNHV